MGLEGYYIEKWSCEDTWFPCRLVNSYLNQTRWVSILIPCHEGKWHVTVFYSYKDAHNAIRRSRRVSREVPEGIKYRLRVLATPPERNRS